MIEKQVINFSVEVTAANDNKEGCILSCKINVEGQPMFGMNMPANPLMYDLDKGVLAARIGAKVGRLADQLLAQLAFPRPSSLQEESLPPDQQGKT